MGKLHGARHQKNVPFIFGIFVLQTLISLSFRKLSFNIFSFGKVFLAFGISF